MALTFVVTKDLTSDVTQNVLPYFVHTPYIINEPDNSLFQYYIKPDNREAWDKRADVALGQYDVLPWVDPQKHLSMRAVAKIGAKQFPQIGAIGFYKDLYTSQSYILAPVHAEHETFDPPTLVANLTGKSVSVSITPPKDVTYTCYKIIMRCGYFAVEYVVYNLNSIVPAPLVNGQYTIHVIGYNELKGIYSSWSNIEYITITNGNSTWEPEPLKLPMRLADLVDVSIADLLNAQMLRYNVETQKWENVSSTDVGATRIVMVTLYASDWVATDQENKHTQVVYVKGVTPNSKVDLQPSDEQLTDRKSVV